MTLLPLHIPRRLLASSLAMLCLVYNRYPDVYEPGPSAKFSARFKRPYGFDQDLPC